jgi:ABC-type sugar transport system ATPase subunit
MEQQGIDIHTRLINGVNHPDRPFHQKLAVGIETMLFESWQSHRAGQLEALHEEGEAMTNVLELKNIRKSFPGVIALKEMHLTLNKGEVHAVCGENGAGKSTLMKIITGVYQPDEGEILLNGQRVHIQEPNEAFSKGIAIIYQETSLIFDMTVLENLFLGHEPVKKHLGFITTIDYQAMRTKAQEIFKKLGMHIDLNMTVRELGVAAKQMVEIAKALTYDAHILILDEPTAALTIKEVRALYQVMKRLKSEGVSMLYISHRLDEIFEMADKVTVIRDGQYITTADVKDVNNEQLISMMVGRKLENLYPKTEVEIGDVIFQVKGLSQDGVLHHIDLELRQGEILGIAGLAGSGRTELAHAICGLTRLDKGDILLNKRTLTINHYRKALDYGIVYVSEDRKDSGLVVAMSIKENITLALLNELSKYSFIDGKGEERISQKYMADLSIKAPNDDFIVENLSGGNQQKVSVAKALANSPKVLIMDEPTRGVDVGAKAEIYRIISALACNGLSIILISSDLPEVLGMSDRICVMKQGSIVGEFSREEVTQEKVLAVAL